MGSLLELLGATFADMNVHLVPSFHCAIHFTDHLFKYGNAYNSWLYGFEQKNQVLMNVNTNGHGHGVLEATMAKGYMRRAEAYRYVKKLQDLDQPTCDDIDTTKALLSAMRNGPEHEKQCGMLAAVLAGEARFRGQEHIHLTSVSAKVNFMARDHQQFYQLMVRFCNQHNPFEDVKFYGIERRPPGGVKIQALGSTVSYSHFFRHGVGYGSADHYRGQRL
ncbi:hypothetical protein FRC12_004831 [Ceratobasidium sp. 428]|nr:hypothetical protein FRC12_004831 [Ceratobasidium sp. 428]